MRIKYVFLKKKKNGRNVKIKGKVINGIIKGIIVLVPTYITAYLTDKMVYVIPMLAAVSFIAESIDGIKIERKVDEGYKGKEEG